MFDQPDKPLAFEIGSSPDHSRAGVQAVMERHPRFKRRCYLVSPQASVSHPASTSAGVGTLPLDVFLLAVGAQAEKALASNLCTAS